MPLINIDTVRGRSDDEIHTLLDAVHDAVVQAFEVPETDRYQLITQHEPSEVIALDTGLGIPRTDDIVIIRVTSRIRPDDAKKRFYQLLAQHLTDRCAIAPSDVIVMITENGPADWSFGHGSAQFLTGEL